MKKILVLLLLSIGSFSVKAQVFTGMSEVDKSKKEGVYTFVNTQEKYARASWKAYLSKFGKVIEGKNGSFSSSDLKISSISDSPLIVVSKVSEENKKVKLFISIATGSDDYIQTGHAKISEASAWIEDFIKIVDLEEGVSAEASSLAGTQQLGNLKVIYDDNRISIEGDTHLAFTEDVSARYRAYGWNVIEVAAQKNGDVDRDQLETALLAAVNEKDRPVLIRLHTVIAWPAPKASGTAKSHGSALGAEEVAATKIKLGLDPNETFIAPSLVIDHVRKIKERSANLYKQWQTDFTAWQKSNPQQSNLLNRLISNELPQGWDKELPIFPSDKEIATRAASGKVIAAIAKTLPEFWGGSADLAESNNTTIESGTSFLPASSQIAGANPYGRVVHFGIREHAMGAILNGVALHGLTKPFAGTFLVFSDYMRGAVRLSALMQLPVTYVWTHDSIGLGEDGPTHQPVEHLAALRAIPGLAVVRPADANEVSVCWRQIISDAKPVGLSLSRQNLPVIDRTQYAPATGASKGAYVLAYGSESNKDRCDVILIATGSEVSLAIAAREQLMAGNIKARVVSAPCIEWFMNQPENYRNDVLPKNLRARVSIEAGIAQPWYQFIGDAGVAVSLEHFGASASAPVLFKEFGFTVENIVNAAKESIRKANG